LLSASDGGEMYAHVGQEEKSVFHTPSLLEPHNSPVQNWTVNTTNLGMQAAHLNAQAQKLCQVAQLMFEAHEAEESARLGRRLLGAQAEEAEAASRLARCRARMTSQMTTANDLTHCGELAPAHHQTTSHKQQKGSNTVAAPTEGFTTLMLRNMPNSCTRNMLLELLDQEGLFGLYDLVYAPVDFSRLTGLGYAFVNFTSPAAAEVAKQKLHGFTGWKNTRSRKICEVSWSGPFQGLSEHIEQYRNSPVMHEKVPECYKPALFRGGQRQPFPAPTTKIRAPRVKRQIPCEVPVAPLSQIATPSKLPFV
jgi:hypothetical protein